MKRVKRVDYPWWVKVSILGVPGRNGLWACVAISLAIGLGCLVYGRQNALYFFGVPAVLAAIPYWLSVRWIDAHGSWDEEPE